MTNPLRAPGGQGDMFEAHVYKGQLLLVYTKAYNPTAKTSKGIGPRADCDVIVVSGAVDPATGQPPYFENAALFGNLGKSVGADDGLNAYTLGVLDQKMTASGNLAWILADATEDPSAVAAANPWLARHQQKQFVAPAKPDGAGPPTEDPWAGVNAAPATPAPNYGAPAAQGWGGAPAAAAPSPAPAAPAQQGWGAAPAATPAPASTAPAAAPTGAPPANDPNIALLINKGVDPTVVMSMDPATRAAVLATYGG